MRVVVIDSAITIALDISITLNISKVCRLRTDKLR